MKNKTAPYSVLMSVYNKEKPSYLRESMLSIYNQTLACDDFVLICDGPLTMELDAVVEEMHTLFGDVLNVHRLEQNSGLGNALNAGLSLCRNDIIIRMDSDDISVPERCELQYNYLIKHPQIGILSGTVIEFTDSTDNVIGKRTLPSRHDDICAFSRKRNPFNHPASAFRKEAVKQAGNYKETYHLFEDYYLWIRMLQNGVRGHNLKTPLVYMRTPHDIYKRRGGFKYAMDMLRFHWWIKTTGWTSVFDFISGAIPHALVCILPNFMRRIVYIILRK